MNPGGVRSDLTYAQSGTEGDGVVTYGEAFTFQPFGNTLVTYPMTGAQIVSVLEEQCQPAGSSRPFLHLGVSDGFTYDLAKTIWRATAPRSTVSNVQLNGVPLDLTATLQRHGEQLPGRRRGQLRHVRHDHGAASSDGGNDLQALINYMQAFSPLDPPCTDRVNELP